MTMGKWLAAYRKGDWRQTTIPVRSIPRLTTSDLAHIHLATDDGWLVVETAMGDLVWVREDLSHA